jgi:hypothetical protein
VVPAAAAYAIMSQTRAVAATGLFLEQRNAQQLAVHAAVPANSPAVDGGDCLGQLEGDSEVTGPSGQDLEFLIAAVQAEAAQVVVCEQRVQVMADERRISRAPDQRLAQHARVQA